MNVEFVINPLSGKPIKKGSVIYQKLLKKGIITEENTKPKVVISKSYDALAKEAVSKKQQELFIKQQEQIKKNEELLAQQDATSWEDPQDEEPKRYIGGKMIKSQQQIAIPLAQKVKKPLKEKVSSVIEDTLLAYKSALRGVPDDLPDHALDQYIYENLITELRKTKNKYILKNINDLV